MEKKYYLWGLDVSLKNTGLAIYDLEEKRFVHIDSFNTESLKTTYDYKGLDLTALKIGKIKEWIEGKKKEFPPYFVVIEEMVLVKRQYGYNINEIKGIAKATGTIQSLLWNVHMELYYPTEVKSAVLSGNASKMAVQQKILEVYPELQFKNDDESDATAVALCHLINVGIIEWEKPAKPVKKATKKKATSKKTVDKNNK